MCKREPRDGGGLVTHSECAGLMGPLATDLGIIKKALVGDDLRHGLVKEFGEMKSDIGTIKGNQNNSKTQRDKWKWAAICFAFTLLGLLVKCGIDALLHQ